MGVVESGATLLEEKGGEPTSNQLVKLAVLGWCVKLLHERFLIADDIMDRSDTRRGKPSWYKLVNMGAINDAMLLQKLVDKALKRYFQADDCYQKLVDLVSEANYITLLGQLSDT